VFNSIQGAIDSGYTIDGSVLASIKGLITLAAEDGENGQNAFSQLATVTAIFNELAASVGTWNYS